MPINPVVFESSYGFELKPESKPNKKPGRLEDPVAKFSYARVPSNEEASAHDSSLPVSRIMVTFCGGEPTDKETVKVTLWWKPSLLVVAPAASKAVEEEEKLGTNVSGGRPRVVLRCKKSVCLEGKQKF
ncbi:hypothetical protein F3Y22_tig00110187pilonHSYRG00091 [Hibiscus syriacus]|uniref:Uncharacterized protein n=1 Tax=Hibiscus syriacus TaxID=106335 RepID=A0A6A3BIF9_HIBSY|nr:hypothetical protein F3Y22_tig00110187pilonHSYRG00091 [Hibiscus syriacus]